MKTDPKKMSLRFIGAGLIALAVAASTAWAATPAPEELLPADTLAVVTVPNWSQAQAKYRDWPLHKLWTDPSMKAFREKFDTKFTDEFLKPLEKQLGVKLGDYKNLAQGQVTLAVIGAPNGDTEAPPAVLLLVDAGAKSDALKTNLANLKKHWIETGRAVKTTQIRGQAFDSFVVSKEELSNTLDKIFPAGADEEKAQGPAEEKPADKKFEIFVGQSEGLLIAGNSEKAIEKVLIRRGGGSVPSLAEKAAFATSRGAMFRNAFAYGWFDLKTVFDLVGKAQQPGAAQGGLPQFNIGKLLEVLGINGLQALAFDLRELENGLLVEFQLNVPEAERKGIFKILSAESKNASPPPFVPADVVKFSRWRINLQKAWASTEAMITEISPASAGVLKMIIENAGKDKDPNFDLRRNLIGNLGDDVISYEKNPRTFSLADLQSPPSLFLIGSPQPDQLAAALKSLSFLMPPQMTKLAEREFLGRKIYSFSLPTMAPGANGQVEERNISYAASGSYVAISTDPGLLEEYLRSTGGSGKSLRETPGLAAAAQKVGGMDTGFFGYENQRESMRAVVEAMKNNAGKIPPLSGASPLTGKLAESEAKLTQWFDFSLLPAYDRIAKYFFFDVYSSSATARGLSLQFYSPNPPNLD